MLSELTEYFIKYKKLYIPSLGSFRLTELPATLDFADRLIYPPTCKVSYFENEERDEDQIIFISETKGIDKANAEQQLSELGQQLKNKIQQSDTTLKGLGTLKYLDEKFIFQPYAHNLLLPVTANKVIRENAHHAVLVGEQEMQSNNMHEVRHIRAKQIPFYILAALIILILAIAYIIYRFYSKGFSTSAAGLG